MSSKPRVPAGADPWWGVEGAGVDATAEFGAALLEPATTSAVRRRRSRRDVRPLPVRIAVLPLTLVAAGMRRSPAYRRLVMRTVVIGAVLMIVGGAVGVILVNNLVISRSAELGKLDQERRDLQRDNAVLGAKAAKQSANQVVMFKARKQLGMIESPSVPAYIYLEPCSHPLTAVQRAAMARRAALGTAGTCTPAAATKPPAVRSASKGN
jgi:hypothetical protein